MSDAVLTPSGDAGTLDLGDYHPAPDVLAGRVVLVTGAGDGIGRAAALALAAHGAEVILLGRTVAKLERVYDAIEAAHAAPPAIYPLDLLGASYPDYERLAGTLAERYGRLDGLLHNAAERGDPTPLARYDPELWARVIHVNLHAPFMLTQVCIELLGRAADPAIAFTADESGRRPRAYAGAYGVSKLALEGVMRILADELTGRRPVRVNSVDPGPVDTALRRRAFPGRGSADPARPADVADAFVYLLGPDARGVSGRALTLLRPAAAE